MAHSVQHRGLFCVAFVDDRHLALAVPSLAILSLLVRDLLVAEVQLACIRLVKSSFDHPDLTDPPCWYLDAVSLVRTAKERINAVMSPLQPISLHLTPPSVHHLEQTATSQDQAKHLSNTSHPQPHRYSTLNRTHPCSPPIFHRLHLIPDLGDNHSQEQE